MVQRPAKYEVALRRGAKVLTVGGTYHTPKWKTLELSPGNYLVIVGKPKGGLTPETSNILIEVRGGHARRRYEAKVKDLIPLTEYAKRRLMGD